MNELGQGPSIYIYSSEIGAITAEAESYPDRETGGDLYGAFSHAGLPTVWLALGPGPKAHRATAEFQQDASFTTEWQKKLHNSFGLQYIGGWHSHHTLGLEGPSQGDIRVARDYAIRHHRRWNVEIIVTLECGRANLWGYYYPNAQEGQLSLAPLMILEGESPVRLKLGAPDSTPPHRTERQSRRLHSNRQESKAKFFPTWPFFGKPESEGLAIPEILNREVSALYGMGLEDVSVENRGKLFLIAIRVSDRTIGVALETSWRDIKITQMELIDEGNGIRRDIEDLTEGRLRVKGIGIEGGTLAKICAQAMEYRLLSRQREDYVE